MVNLIRAWRMLALAPLLLTPAMAWADTQTNDVDLVCDVQANLALVRFMNTRAEVYTFPRLPQALDRGLSARGRSGTECTLANGTTVRVRGGDEQAFGYGAGGGNPPAFFSVWINRRKVISQEVWKPGYEATFDNPPIYDGALIDSNRVTICATAEGKPQRCQSRPIDLAKSPVDRVEYPANTRKALIGHISVIAKGEVNQRFCEAYLASIKAEFQSALNGASTPLDVDPQTFAIETAAGEGTPRSGLVTLLPGLSRRLFIWEGGNHYFDGTAIAVAPPGMAIQDIVKAYPFDDIDSWSAHGAPQGVTLISGGQKQLYPRVSPRYVHLVPQMVEGALYVFAHPTNKEFRPTAALVKPLADGGFATICAFNRTEAHF